MREIEKEKEKDRERLIGVKRERMLTEWEGDVAEGETVEREREWLRLFFLSLNDYEYYKIIESQDNTDYAVGALVGALVDFWWCGGHGDGWSTKLDVWSE